MDLRDCLDVRGNPNLVANHDERSTDSQDAVIFGGDALLAALESLVFVFILY
jgi:hypothetical protein